MLLSNAFDPDPRVYQEAKTLVSNGYSVTILCWDRDRKALARENIDGIHVRRVYVRSTHGRGSTQMIFLLAFWLKAFFKAYRWHFDIVHCHDFDTLPMGLVLAHTFKARLIYDSHESYVDMLSNLPSYLRRLIYLAENVLIARADLVITVGEILEAQLKKRGAKKTCVVGNWKDPDIFRLPSELIMEEKKKLGISDGQLVISFIANLGMERQVPQFLEAAKETQEVFLIIGGDGPARPIVEKAAKECSNIMYLGYVNPKKIPLYTALSDAIFYGFDPKNPNARFSAPNKLFEALACGKPVISGDFGEIGKIIKKEKCGILLQNYSSHEIKRAFSKLLEPGIAKTLGARAHDVAVRKYCWQKASQTLLDKVSAIFNQRD